MLFSLNQGTYLKMKGFWDAYHLKALFKHDHLLGPSLNCKHQLIENHDMNDIDKVRLTHYF